ncbi:39S ribosomal protein L13, mitochondrial [Holothuria leucospilota]|uniref:39S ribosomal protein L13, mitochondrial n=1 Tax=Holothuria leucospilota TaxID=206669 RepID=A0A9Q1H550_HOLLE|nr:39S ribosomal protein L13, mitochondrial [Holothuria leucospilota]
MNECAECHGAAGFNNSHSFEGSVNTPCSWLQWEMDKDGRMMKIQEEGTVGELVEHITAILPQFLQHCYVKREQAAAYNAQREKALSESHNSHSALLQVDFSENFTCVAQDEIQSAHWNQRQVSLFTAALWHSGSLHSHILVSDNLTHSKDTITAYMDVLLGYLPDSVSSISIWSDGPASQFKNRYMAASLHPLGKAHKIDIEWNFFATSHGKGPVDGIGGSAKRFVMQKVLNGQHIVTNAASFADAAVPWRMYPGGHSMTPAYEVHAKDPKKIVHKAIYGMMPKHLHRRTMMTRLHLFPDDIIPPEILENISEQIKPPIDAVRRLDEYTEEERAAFPRLFIPKEVDYSDT